MSRKPAGPLRRGWTTGACATAATKAAFAALLTGRFPDPVEIALPKGERPSFAVGARRAEAGWRHRRHREGRRRRSGRHPRRPDPRRSAVGPAGSGIRFRAGEGVGRVTKAGLPLAVGEPAINPAPRRMMGEVVEELARAHGRAADVEITIAVAGGAEMAKQTWNGRLGILGGLSILGTTGIVHPYSCSAWIASIHRGIDVARANGLEHVAACTGSTSEAGIRRLYDLPDFGIIDMGDFAGGMLKYCAGIRCRA